MVKSKRWIVPAVFIFWVAIAVIATSTAFIAMRGNSFEQWFSTFQPMFVYYVSWALISVIVYRLIVRPIKTVTQVMIVAALNIGVLLVMIVGMPFLIHYNQWQEWLFGDRAIGFRILGGAIFLFVLMANLALKYYQRGTEQALLHVREQQKSNRLEGELNRVKVDALMMQVNPHFLFNSLNSIASLIEMENKTKAYETTVSLGDLLRLTLERSEKQMTTMGEELAFIEQYLALEQVRFSDRLEYTCTVDASLKNREIPAFILQPIVENTIKHAVGKTNQLINIKLTVTTKNDTVWIEISDDGPGFESLSTGGVGLNNIRRRLELLYDQECLFSIKSKKGEGVLANIAIPPQLANVKERS